MKHKLILFIIALAGFTILSAHNLFIKLESFYLKPNTETLFYVYNGTFGESQSILARDRMVDVSMVNPGEKISHPDTSNWYEKNNQTILPVKTGNEGTGVFGISTLPRINNYTPEVFEENMKHEGLLEVLEARKKSGEASNPTSKKYSKHVKAIFQIGSELSDDYTTELGYPIELIPVNNPYSLKVGDELSVKVLVNGKPMSDINVYASFNDRYGYAKDDSPIDAFQARTDSDGIVKAKISEVGHWYFRTVHLIKNPDEGAEYISNSSTLTFEIKK